ncbi:MAG: hypothetical protein HDS10_02475 [Bacteroides sp.]|nr:hypothetical protein [Bacteroides sp.]
MKNSKGFSFIPLMAIIMMSICSVFSAKAQYAQIASKLPELISPALSGSMNYKGFVEATGTVGVGSNRVNFFGVSTSQGFQYASWFFMGAGIGVDVANASGVDNEPLFGVGRPNASSTRAMIPLFSDFRFNIGQGGGPSFFIDIKAGAAWIIGGNLLVRDGVVSNSTKFLLRPSIGVRIPTNANNPKQAVNIGVTYQLLTANNSWDYWNNYYDTTLSSFGATVSYEW